eukprot:609406-Rhodomonas_salina.1
MKRVVSVIKSVYQCLGRETPVLMAMMRRRVFGGVGGVGDDVDEDGIGGGDDGDVGDGEDDDDGYGEGDDDNDDNKLDDENNKNDDKDDNDSHDATGRREGQLSALQLVVPRDCHVPGMKAAEHVLRNTCRAHDP